MISCNSHCIIIFVNINHSNTDIMVHLSAETAGRAAPRALPRSAHQRKGDLVTITIITIAMITVILYIYIYDMCIYIYIYRERERQVLLRGVATLRYSFLPSASVQWHSDGFTIRSKTWLLGAGFLGALPTPLSLPSRHIGARPDCIRRLPQIPRSNSHLS